MGKCEGCGAALSMRFLLRNAKDLQVCDKCWICPGCWLRVSLTDAITHRIICSDYRGMNAEILQGIEDCKKGHSYDGDDLIREIQTGEKTLTVAEKNIGWGI